MTNTDISCTWPKTYVHMTEALINDQKRVAIHKRTEEIVEILQAQLDKNKTKTMTFTEDGLMLSIKMIKELYGISN